MWTKRNRVLYMQKIRNDKDNEVDDEYIEYEDCDEYADCDDSEYIIEDDGQSYSEGSQSEEAYGFYADVFGLDDR